MKEYRVKRHKLQTVHSTNSYLKELNGGDASFNMELATAEFQTAGRGQKGNSWESDEGANLLFSILLHPTYVQASKQFCISQAIALAVVDALKEIVHDPSIAEPFTVKWPNDIYWGSKKIAGILIENELYGSTIKDCIIGVGLNVNQQLFKSDAPNPISLYNILGVEVDREELLNTVIRNFIRNIIMIESKQTAQLHNSYMQTLFRKEGFHKYRDEDGKFMAAIHSVRDDGRLILLDANGKERVYEFKEVAIVLEN